MSGCCLNLGTAKIKKEKMDLLHVQLTESNTTFDIHFHLFPSSSSLATRSN